MTKNTLSYVFFDVGGVIISDFSGTNRWNDLLSDMGVTESNYSRFMHIWNSHKDRISLDYDIQNMVEQLRNDIGLSLPDSFCFLDEFVNRFSKNPFINQPLETIRQSNLRAGLITNMYIGMLDKIKKVRLLPDFPFDPIIDSSIAGLQKPDAAIFAYAQSLVNVPPGELLFIDNVEINTKAAAALGWKTFFYDSSNMKTSSRQLDALIRQLSSQ